MNNREAFDYLLGKYWNIAYTEGKTGESQGDKANEVLHKLREAISSQSQQGKERDLEMVEQIKARLKEIKSHSQDVSHITFNPLPPATTSQAQQESQAARLQAAIEGECNGLAVDLQTAQRILNYVSLPPAPEYQEPTKDE